MNNRYLLIVDDEPSVIISLKRELRHEGYDIYSANSGKAGLDLLKTRPIGVVLSDQVMPEMDGVTFLDEVRQQKPDVPRILLTGPCSLDNAMSAVNRSKIYGYLTKPWSSEALRGMLASAFEHYNILLENKRLLEVIWEQNRELKSLNEKLEDLVRKRT